MSMKNHKTRTRIRDFAFNLGQLETGKSNAITDVPGIKIGHSTIIKGNGKLIPGKGPIRTGVTIIKPHEGNIYREKVRASSFVLNGYGKTIGLVQVDELGYIESFIALTNTLNVPIVANALIDYHIKENPDIGITTSSINVVVAECNDGYLNDMQGRHVKKEHVLEAIENASEIVKEGAIGAGTGMTCYGFKGGIGTSSRIVAGENEIYTLGILVLTNFGNQNDLTILGKQFTTQKKQREEEQNHGSVIIILATDAPLNSRQLNRLAKRVPMGLARTGSFASWGSGDIIIAFSTVNRVKHDSREEIFSIEILNEQTNLFNDLLKASVEATEEAVLNSLCKAQSIKGRDDNFREALPLDQLKKLLND